MAENLPPRSLSMWGRQPTATAVHYSDPPRRGTAFGEQRLAGLLADVSDFFGIAEMRFHDFGISLHGQNDCLLFQPGR